MALSAYAAGKSIFLGKAEEDVWDKNFKIRLTSTQTGRKIDIKVAVSKDELKFSDDEE